MKNVLTREAPPVLSSTAVETAMLQFFAYFPLFLLHATTVRSALKSVAGKKSWSEREAGVGIRRRYQDALVFFSDQGFSLFLLSIFFVCFFFVVAVDGGGRDNDGETALRRSIINNSMVLVVLAVYLEKKRSCER